MPPRQPPEWAPHDGVWIGFPSHAALWEDDLAPAQVAVAAFARAVDAEGAGERVMLVAADEAAAARARGLVGDRAEVAVVPFGDIWLRDTGPILVTDGSRLAARTFGFNGWGGKYVLPDDDSIGRRLAERAGLMVRHSAWILEGGAIDVDGTGLVVTTEQCLLNANRNPGLSRAEVERRLADELGLDRVLWLGEGLTNDHTDGHVDNLARFVAPGRLAIPVARAADDPNADVYRDAWARAEAFGVELVAMPSPGLVRWGGDVVAASYMNFYIGNAAVVVPTYGVAADAAALAALAAIFPDRRVAGVRAEHVLTGGGSLHCISQQVPRR